MTPTGGREPARAYAIPPLDAPLPALAGRTFDPAAEPFCARPFAPIDRYRWEGDYRPEARAYVAWDARGLWALLCARERTIRAAATTFNAEVYRDSCLEWFLQPFPDDPRYLNLEVNAAGAALIGIGPDRRDRRRLAACPEGMDIQASVHAGDWWAVRYCLPGALIGALYGRPWTPGGAMRGNFYKCDETLHPHFGSWSPIDSPSPDFHRPECFGRLALACV